MMKTLNLVEYTNKDRNKKSKKKEDLTVCINWKWKRATFSNKAIQEMGIVKGAFIKWYYDAPKNVIAWKISSSAHIGDSWRYVKIGKNGRWSMSVGNLIDMMQEKKKTGSKVCKIQKYFDNAFKETKGLDKILDEFDEEVFYDHQSIGCGIEDNGIHDRYQASEYGFNEAVCGAKNFITKNYNTIQQDLKEEFREKIDKLPSEKILVGDTKDGTFDKPIELEFIRKQDILKLLK